MSVSFEYVFLKDDMPCKSEKCPLSIKANLQRFRRLVPVLIVIFPNLSLNIASKSLIQAHLLTLVEQAYLFSQGTLACKLFLRINKFIKNERYGLGPARLMVSE